MKFYHLFIKKFLKGKNKYFFTLENILSIAGIFIGVFSILIVSSVMNGFDKDIRSRLLNVKPEIIIRKKDYSEIKNYSNLLQKLKNLKSVQNASAIIKSELVALKDNRFSPVICMGIAKDDLITISNIKNKIVLGSINSFDRNSVILGMDLSLQLHATVGEKIVLSDIKGKIPTPFGLLPVKRELKLVGIYRTGLPDFDKNVLFVDLKFLQSLLSTNGISYIQIKSKNGDTKRAYSEIKKIISSQYTVEDWTKLNTNLFHAIKLEKAVMMFVLFLMIIIASFNMGGFLVKFIESKKYEIGILKTIGMENKNLSTLFLQYSLFLGIFGSVSAAIISFLIIYFQNVFHFIEIPVPGLPLRYLPMEIKITEFIIVPLTAIFISYLSVIYPLKRIKKVEIIKILREKE